MLDHQRELDHLAKANQHIAEAEERINELTAQIEEGRAAGWDTAVAEDLLKATRESLAQWHVYLRLILEGIGHH